MNDKTREQIEAMKMQTIGVEVEMNNITRESRQKGCRVLRDDRMVRSQRVRVHELGLQGPAGQGLEIPARHQHPRTGS